MVILLALELAKRYIYYLLAGKTAIYVCTDKIGTLPVFRADEVGVE
ncbi:MAG: hypothetical protein V4620_08950 [Bacteroidota bacterium]